MPRVIDFGVAKATNQKLTEKTLFTNYATMIGTPAYMSPEQAEMSSMDVEADTGEPRTPPMAHGPPLFHAAFSKDGRFIVTGCSDGTVRIWDADTGEPLVVDFRSSVSTTWSRDIAALDDHGPSLTLSDALLQPEAGGCVNPRPALDFLSSFQAPLGLPPVVALPNIPSIHLDHEVKGLGG